MYIFILGACLGSFLNAWIWRTHNNIRIWANNRSICIFCGYQLSWKENIPILSWFWLRGLCKKCHRPISIQYPLVEFSAGILSVFVMYYNLNLPTVQWWYIARDFFFLFWLIIVFVYDFKYQIILTDIVWLGSVVGLSFNMIFFDLPFSSFLLGMIIGGGFFYLQYIVSRGRWIGGGDVRLGIMMGAWLGWQGVVLALFIAYVSGGLFGSVLLLLKRAKGNTAIPFGTFLAIGTMVSVFYGVDLINWYLGLIR